MTSQIASIITTAIARGFTAKTILQHLTRNFPQYAKTIANASAMGYAADKILKHLVDPRGKNPDSDDYLTESEKADKSTKQNKRRAALGLGAAALTATGLGVGLASSLSSTAARGAATQLLPMLGQTPQGPPPPTSPTNPPIPGAPINPPPQAPQSPGQMAAPQSPMPGPQIGQQIAQGVQQPIAQGMQPATQAEMGQAAQAMPQPGQQLPSVFEELTKNIDVKSLSPEKVKQLQFVKTISDKLEQEGKPITDPAFQGVAKKIKSILQGKPGTVIEETARIAGTQVQQPIVQPQEPKITSVDAPPIPIVKNSIVSTPNGVGEVKGISNGKAIVDIDGKAHKVDEKDIEPPIYTDDDVADAYDRIMEVIPEEHRSGFIQWAGYDEERNVLGFIPRAGKYEELQNITPDEAKMIKEGKGVARTTGEKREGLWIAGEDTRGGIISQIIWDRKKKKSAEDDKQLFLGLELPKKEKQDRGMKPIFDEMGYARGKSRERERAIKLAEKERIKKEKDEAKKRKK